MNKIDAGAFVTALVSQDYRTAAVFRKYEIDFCCGAKYTLEVACAMRGLELAAVLADLEKATVNIHISNSLPFEKWGLAFLTDYISHIHHDYLRMAMPEAFASLSQFADGHRTKYEWLGELESVFTNLVKDTLPQLRHEEEIIFPYVRQVEDAYVRREPYAGLLVRTLRKPIGDVMNKQYEHLTKTLNAMRSLTHTYTTSPNACTNHKVCFSMLRDLDRDLVQHLHLEHDILFPRTIDLERELLCTVKETVE